MRPHKITKEIYQVGGGQLTSPEDAAIYLINIDGLFYNILHSAHNPAFQSDLDAVGMCCRIREYIPDDPFSQSA